MFSQIQDEMFPEFAETEDECVRKELLEVVNDLVLPDEQQSRFVTWLEKQQKPVISDDALREGIAHFGITQYQIDNWLKKYVDVEKQGEQKPKFRVGDTIKCKYDDRQFTIKSVNLDKGTYTYTQEGCGNDIDYADEEFELVEQKVTAWNEEDEMMLSDIIKDLVHPWNEYIPDRIEDEIKWLKNRLKSLRHHSPF